MSPSPVSSQLAPPENDSARQHWAPHDLDARRPRSVKDELDDSPTSETSEPMGSGHATIDWTLSCDNVLFRQGVSDSVDLIYEHSRIRLGADKQTLLSNRLQKRLRMLGLKSYDDYCAVLQSPDGYDEIEELVDLISTNHTKFFREPDHFSFLVNRALPALIPRLVYLRSPLRLWSAAASSGEEPYTMAIVVAEHLRAYQSLEWQVTASDISRRMLAHAQRGIYQMDAVQTVPPELLKRYFQKGVGIRAGTCRIKPELKERLRFERINLFQAYLSRSSETACHLLSQRHDLF